MRKQIVFYSVSITLYVVGLILLTEIANQRIGSLIEAVMVIIPILINLSLILYALYFTRREEKIRTGGVIIFLGYFSIVLITFSVSVTVCIMLYMDIIPTVGRFL